MKRYIAALAATAALVLAPAALADPPETGWICHGTGSESNPYQLLNVPTNSAHFTKHLPDGTDKEPFAVEGGYSCTSADSDPEPPFHGKLFFSLDPPTCAANEFGIPGFTVTQPGHKIQVESFVQGQLTETEIFVFPPVCVPLGAGAAGPQGPAGPAGPAGTVKETKCRWRRVFIVHLPKRFAGVTRVRVKIGGIARTQRVSKKGNVRVSFRGRKPGIYAVVIRGGGHRVDRLYALCGNGNVEGYNVP